MPIQTINRIDMYDNTCIGVDFYYVPKIIDFINTDSHTLTYLHLRDMQRELGEVMGLDSPDGLVNLVLNEENNE